MESWWKILFLSHLLMLTAYFETCETVLTISKLFQLIDPEDSVRHQSFVFLGNISHSDIGASAIHNKNVDTHSMLQVTDKPEIFSFDAEDNSIFFMCPVTMDAFYESVDLVSKFYGESLRKTKRSRHTSIFFLVWPTLTNKDFGQEMMDSLEFSGHLDHLYRGVGTIPQNSHVYLLFGTERGSTFGVSGIMELYGINQKVPIINSLDSLVYLSQNSRIKISKLFNFATRRSNFNGAQFNIVANKIEDDSAPEIDVRVTQSGEGIETVEFHPGGPSYQILMDLCQSLNFTYTPILGDGWIVNRNGRPTGIARQVFEGKADISASTFSIQEYRAKEILFLPAINTADVCIFFRQPMGHSKTNTLMGSFSTIVWYLILVTWILVGVSGVVISLNGKSGPFLDVGIDNNYFENYVAKNSIKKKLSVFSDMFIWSISMFCQQGWFCNNPTTKTAWYVLTLTALMTSLLLYTFYTSKIISAISAPYIPIRNYSDFSKFGIDVFASGQTVLTLTSFTSDKKEIDRVGLRSQKMFKTHQTAVETLMTAGSQLALLASDWFLASQSHKYTLEEICSFSMLKGLTGARVKYSMFVPKWADYEEFYKIKTIHLMQIGLNRRYWANYFHKTRPQCNQSHRLILQRITFSDIFLAIMVLVMGFVTSFCFVIIEKGIVLFL